ncbi:hypothetical protein EV702DRAFT_1046298 [Suillus placidus]|uniref:Uncharacterized protein n=1 Tax=Suillus placidus TaxID=48579 RepID=A0A9P6ZUH9_9AGAM|nr:hypothetical protein EV702DRAFT_1046298 [Suillus placidus]
MPKQNKSVLQKQYRNKELDGFSLVRAEIRHATGGEIDPKTRQDVLRKAARLIRELSVLNTKLQHQLYKSRHTNSETPPIYVEGLPAPISSNLQVIDSQQVLVRRAHIPLYITNISSSSQTASAISQAYRQLDHIHHIHVTPAQAMNYAMPT